MLTSDIRLKKNVISITLTVAWLVVPDGLVLVFQNILISRDFYTQQFVEFSVVRKKKAYRNTLLKREVRGKLPDCFELKGSLQ